MLVGRTERQRMKVGRMVGRMEGKMEGRMEVLQTKVGKTAILEQQMKVGRMVLQPKVYLSTHQMLLTSNIHSPGTVTDLICLGQHICLQSMGGRMETLVLQMMGGRMETLVLQMMGGRTVELVLG